MLPSIEPCLFLQLTTKLTGSQKHSRRKFLNNTLESEIHTDDFDITPLGEWTSPHTNCTYPQGWDIRVGELNLTVTPVMADQELVGPQTYWEGAALVSGDATGRAYVELAGYCNQ